MPCNLDRRIEYWITHPIGIFVCPAIDAVVAGVDAALGEPGDVAVLEAPAAHGLEVAVPVQQLAGGLPSSYSSMHISGRIKSWGLRV